MRLYVPLTLPRLAVAHRQGELGPVPLAAFAVTPALRAWCGLEDLEELEYTALGRAALASLRLLADDAGAPSRRVVVAVDVADDAVREADHDLDDAALGQVRVDAAVPFAKAAAVHLDAPGAAGDVAAAARALHAADAGDGAARAAVEAAEDLDLLWYATQEVEHLLAEG
ncbi:MULTISPECIES: DUF6912 family protein [Streptomyces]|uniref:DUF6912 family protein n=1 Tax=Streptomyces TaxID=1883 RepID=UPI002248CABC|nr:hypothetical protein [Streptomyces sp. JHD 1]MCX2970820.1 hypothetical protein [Streptomyces sp. JHD 1]